VEPESKGFTQPEEKDGVAASGRRERKKRQTRQLIAETAARLFAERGYEQVAVVDVADAADVSEQTVYNYFPTKQDLVLDREGEIRDRLSRLIRTRPPGTSPAAAFAEAARGLLEDIDSFPSDQMRGGLAYLAAISPAVRRMSLEVTDHFADAIAAAIIETTENQSPQLAKLQAVALAWVLQIINDETGRRQLAGQQQAQIAGELRPIVEELLDSLDRWFATRDVATERVYWSTAWSGLASYGQTRTPATRSQACAENHLDAGCL
jgi:AcrR family transcriptional regulator